MLNTMTLPFAVTVVLLIALRPIAKMVGLIDQPGGRKDHVGEVPLIGGLSMMGGLVIGSLALGEPMLVDPLLMVGALIVVAVGALDDRYDLSPRSRLLGQATAALIMTLGAGVVITSLGEFGGAPLSLGIWALPFTLLVIMAAINAANMFDGSDGVAAGQALICLAALGIADGLGGHMQHFPTIVVLAGTVLGFMLFNLPFRRTATVRLFMGDAGSMFLGFSLTWLAISMSQGEDAVLSPVCVLWIAALPLLDFFSNVFRRAVSRRPLLNGDRGHLHHLLKRSGLSPMAVFCVEMGAGVAMAAVGLVGHFVGVPDGAMYAALTVVAMLYCLVFGTGLVIKTSKTVQAP